MNGNPGQGGVPLSINTLGQSLDLSGAGGVNSNNLLGNQGSGAMMGKFNNTVVLKKGQLT